MKLTRYEGRAAGYLPRGPSASQIRKEKAIEKTLTSYFMLTCGHLTDWPEQELNEAFRIQEGVKKGYYACSVCFWAGMPSWHRKRPQKKVVYPDDPPF